MKTYYGMLLADRPTLLVHEPGATRLIQPIDPSAGRLTCIPDHISWGDIGPGSARTAYALLYDALEDHDQALALMDSFLTGIVAHLDSCWWALPIAAIHEFALEKQGYLIV